MAHSECSESRAAALCSEDGRLLREPLPVADACCCHTYGAEGIRGQSDNCPWGQM